MSIENLLLTTSRKVVSTANIMIGNNMPFCCYTVDDISITSNDEEITYATNNEILSWYERLFTIDYKIKEIPLRALENMKKNGLTPKKQPAEIMNFIISTNSDHVFIGMLLPEICEYKLSDFVDNFNFPDKIINKIVYNKNYAILSYIADSPLKEKDNCQRSIFEYLKKIGVYKNEDEEEELYEV